MRRLTKLERELLRELKWQRGIQFFESGPNDDLYTDLVEKGLVHREASWQYVGEGLLPSAPVEPKTLSFVVQLRSSPPDRK